VTEETQIEAGKETAETEEIVEDTPDIFDAVSDAIDEQTVGLDTSADDDAPTGDEDDVTPTGENEDDPEEDPENEGGDDEPTGDEPADGEGDDDTPEADKEDLPGGDESGDAGKPATDGTDGAPAAPDHVNDPIPKELKESTQERIRSLAERVKTAEAGVTERSADLTEMIEMVQDTGTSGEQYGQMLGFMKMFNSDDVEQQRAAYKVMQTEVAAMAVRLGEPVVGMDLLEGHQDLQNELELGTITAERANEIAISRSREKADATRKTATDADTAANADIEQAITDAKGELAVYEADRKAKDPQWLAKKASLVPALRATMRVLHPSKWKATFEQSYNELVLPEAAKPTPKPKTPEPLRPKAPAGGSNKEPSSMAEAIELSLGGSIDD